MSDWLNTRSGYQFAASISSIARSLDKIANRQEAQDKFEAATKLKEVDTEGRKIQSLAQVTISDLNSLIDSENDELADILVGAVGVIEQYMNIVRVNK